VVSDTEKSDDKEKDEGEGEKTKKQVSTSPIILSQN